jgi:hypothetical protein
LKINGVLIDAVLHINRDVTLLRPRLDWFHSLSFDIARALLTAQSSLLAAGTHSVASILPFIRPGADFDDEATRIMGEAFDAACKEIHDAAPLDIVHEAMAKRIIEAARKGERDPIRLRDIALAALGIGGPHR